MARRILLRHCSVRNHAKEKFLSTTARRFHRDHGLPPRLQFARGTEWTYEIKLDGDRLEAVRSAGQTTLYSRRKNILSQKFHYIATALKDLPDDTVIDGGVGGAWPRWSA
jgi:ATP-dependent DNA ligase